MRFNIFIILVLVLTQSCKNAPKDYSEISFDQPVTVEWIPMSDDLEIGVPLSMTVDSSTIYILSVAGGNILHGFSVNDGQKTHQFGSVGQGPKEFIAPVNCQVISDSIILYDTGDNALKSIGVDGAFRQRYSLPKTAVINEAFYVTPDSWIGIGANRKIEIYVSDELKGVYNAFPKGLNRAEDWFDLQAHTAYADQHLFYATLLGGFLESFSVSSDSIHLNRRLHLPDCKIAFDSSGNIDYTAITYGFTALCAADGYCFGAYSESSNPDSDSKIGIWDYNLNPVMCLKTDKLVISLCSDGKNLYALTHNNNTGYGLEYIPIENYIY